MSDPTQLTLSLFERITVTPTWEVLTSGANAHTRGGRGKPLFAHQHVPTRPASVRNDTVWLAMLDLAEDARRYNQASRAVLNLAGRDGAGSNGPIGTGDLMLDSCGCREWGPIPATPAGRSYSPAAANSATPSQRPWPAGDGRPSILRASFSVRGSSIWKLIVADIPGR